MSDGDVTNYRIYCGSPTALGSVGGKLNEDITVAYLRSGKTIIETSTGDLRSEIVSGVL